MGVENRRIVLSLGGADFLLQGENLLPGRDDCFVEPLAFGFDLVAFDDQVLRLLQCLAHPLGRPDRDTRRHADPFQTDFSFRLGGNHAGRSVNGQVREKL